MRKNKMIRIALALLICFFTLLSGCSVKNMGNTVKYNFSGEHYLYTEQYQKGANKFQDAVQKSPDNTLANFYYGRFLLLTEKPDQALKYMQKASKLAPNKADYHFWTGVTFGSLGNKTKEKKSYLKALQLDKTHLQSLIYLGHNLLETKKYSLALGQYDKALKIWPNSPSALYNRSLITSKFDRKPEAHEGWLEYLYYYPSGAMARRAVQHLNSLGDFSFRNYSLLSRTVTIEKIYFESFSATISRGSYSSLDLVGTIFENFNKGKLQVLVYQLKNKKLAKQKALNIKKYLLKKHPKLKSNDIGVSWFDTAETISVFGKNKKINDSVQFFVSP
jgi:tetratricopeptide (TPR) repeat protein